MLKPGDTIEYLEDVSSPPNQKGVRGQTKIIDREISLWTAKFLLRGGKIRPYDPASPLPPEEEETEKGPDDAAKIPGPAGTAQDGDVTSTETEKERRTKTNGRGKTNSKTNQGSDSEPEKPGPKRKAGNRRR